jgi:arylsulfatase
MASKQPNILILWGDDIGMWNISHFSRGMMGYQTPNIDRVAKEGVTLTDWYGQQSCTAGRAAFITGQNPLRTGLTKVGMPGATLGLQAEDPTIAELLKPLGYATGQFGKNHLGDRNEFLPTVHGFDEFFGNLYHLNAEEEPELPDYPKDPGFFAKFGPRGVLHCFATDKDDPTTDPRWGRVGKQTIKDTGPLTKKRMETVDEEITSAAIGWIEKQAKAQKPFFLWYNSTAMHFRTTAIGWSRMTSRSVRCLTSSMSWASLKTPSSCIPPTTAPRTTLGQMAPTLPSAARRIPTGKAPGAFLPSSAGRARSNQAQC